MRGRELGDGPKLVITSLLQHTWLHVLYGGTGGNDMGRQPLLTFFSGFGL